MPSGKRRADSAAPRSVEQIAGSCLARALLARGDLVECRVRNLVVLNLGRSFNHLRESLQDFGVGVAAIVVRVLFPIPQLIATASARSPARNVISSLKPFCLRSAGRTSVSTFG